ncbi:MAG TPA: hypothetical protein VFT42_01150 [Solirubrobacteraceae bacterium]|nr:hypothetical protein [Solirubrobacteraceae bacterium]
MKAKARYHLIVHRGSPAHIEVVDIDDGEVALFWDLLPRDARRVEEMLRAELESMDAREFFERWAAFEGDADLR